MCICVYARAPSRDAAQGQGGMARNGGGQGGMVENGEQREQSFNGKKGEKDNEEIKLPEMLGYSRIF